MWEDKLLLCAKSDQVIMRTVLQNVFLILNSVPLAVTSVTDPELIRPSIPVMTQSLDQKVVASVRSNYGLCKVEDSAHLLIFGRLWTKKGLQGGKTIQQRNELFASQWSLMLLPVMYIHDINGLAAFILANS